MKFLVDTGFVIKRINSGEADRFLTVFTKNSGKQEIVAKGVRKISSRRSSHIELLNKVAFHAVKTHKNFILTEVEVQKTYAAIKENSKTIGSMFYICELIDKLCALNQPHPDIFELLSKVLVDLKESFSSEVIFNFQKDLLTSLGFWDGSKQFASAADIEQFIESITERKLKSKTFLYTS